MRSSSVSRLIPALFTSTSMRPCFSATSSTIFCTAAESDTSHWIASALPPAPAMEFTTAASLSAPLATATTWYPSAARRRAIASPIPRLAPVTMATRFSVMDLGRQASAALSGQCVGSVEARHARAPLHFLQQARQHAAGSKLDEAAPGGHERLHGLAPADGLRNLPDQQLLDRISP